MPDAESHRVILGTAGHIDHGKTALVRALTGIDTDRLPEEKARGITIDLGFAHMDLPGGAGSDPADGINPGVRVGIVDVPGHERFVRNMLAGASGIDVAMLVVAADDGVMPQTREHLAILRLLGIPRGLIALSKCDLVESDWVDLIEQDVRDLCAGTFLGGAPIVRTSVATGMGIDDLRTAIASIARTIAQAGDGPFRLAIDRAFVREGVGTVVTGSVARGRVRVGDEIEWQPTGRLLRVRGLHAHGEAVDEATRGSRVAVQLSQVHHSEVRRGHELTSPGLLRASRLVSVELHALPDSNLPIRHRARVRLHMGTGETIAGVRLLGGTSLEPGQRGLAQLVLSEPACASFAQPFVVRCESPVVTLGGGRILQGEASPIRRRDANAIDRLSLLASGDDAARVEQSAWFAGFSRREIDATARSAGLTIERASALLNDLHERGVLASLGGRSLHRDRSRELRERLLGVLASLHGEQDHPGFVALETVRRRVAYLDDALVHDALALLAREGAIVLESDRAMLAAHANAESEEDARLREGVLRALAQGAMKPPEPESIAESLGQRVQRVRGALSECVRRGEAVHMGGAIFLHAAHYATMIGRLRESLSDGRELSVSAFREMMDTSRKFAVPLLEALDKRGFTRRRGDARIAGARLMEARVP